MQHRPKGFALVITLVVLVLVVILVVGLMESTRLDRAAAASNLDRVRAEVASEQGVADVVATLRKNLSDSTQPAQPWINQPGRLFTVAKTNDTNTAFDDTKVAVQSVPLSSGDAPATPGQDFLAPARLNIPVYDGSQANYIVSNGLLNRDGSRATPSSMLLKWIYVRSDGTLDTADTPDLTNTTKPIVSRYAYWTDDESTKLNVNLAWKRDQSALPVSSPLNHPSRANLSTLSLPYAINTASPAVMNPSLVDAVQQYTTTAPGIAFNSLMGIKKSNDDIASIIDADKFNATHYSSVPPATTSYTLSSGKAIYASPIYLTTDSALMDKLRSAGVVPVVQNASAAAASSVPNFIDIVKTPGLDPGYLPYLDPNKLNKVVAAIRIQLLRSDWPLMPSNMTDPAQPKDLITKWFGTGLTAVERVQAADQVAMNIIDYVRIKESKVNLVLPIVAVPTMTTANSINAVYGFKSFRTDTDTSYKGSSEYIYACVSSSGSDGIQNIDNAKWFLGGRTPMITEMTMVIDETSRTKFNSGTPDYWPKKIPTERAPNATPPDHHLLSGATGSDAVMYRCKVYVELYLPNYPGLPPNFEIRLSDTGSSAWPEALPPTDVVSHAGQTGTSMEASAKWYIGLPDETSSVPYSLTLGSGEANVAGASTDGRNHVTYYVVNQVNNRITASTYGKPYILSDGDPLGNVNYAVPYILPREFIGGSAKGILRPGQRVVIAKEFWRTATRAQRPTANMRVGLSFGPYTGFKAQPGLACSGAGERAFGVAMAPLWKSINVPLQAISSGAYDDDDLSGIMSLQVDDPKLGYYPTDLSSTTEAQQWQWLPNTLKDAQGNPGAPNSNTEVNRSPTLASARQDLKPDARYPITAYGGWRRLRSPMAQIIE